MSVLFLLICLLHNILHCELTLTPKVEVSDGIVIGTTYETALGRKVYAFFGIPYAAPPIGDNRFEFPKSVKPWIGEWDATHQVSKCLQYSHYTYSIDGEEDCLYLDVYTSKLPGNIGSENKLLNVIVYIHGGAFMFGSGQSKQPDYLFGENNDLVYVIINYRLGPLGFLSTEDDVVPGNNGLKDQSMALRWIQRNIVKFSGNPLKITLTGMSAGGSSVHYHCLSPMSEGLFSQGISQSGTALVPWALAEGMLEKSKRLANLVGCPSQCSREMVKCLKRRPAKKILQYMKEFQPWRYNPFTPFGPTVETPGRNRFLTEKPVDIIRAGRMINIPWLVSATKDEGLYPAAEFIPNNVLLKEIDENWNSIAPHLLDYNYSVPYDVRDGISEKIRNHFFKDEPINEQNYQTLLKVISDRLFKAYIEFTIRETVKSSSVPVYYYIFNYVGTYSLAHVYAKNTVDYGVSHGDDSQYVIKADYSNPHEIPSESEMIKFMVSMWLSFADKGEPSVGNLKWVPNTQDSLADGITVLQINDTNNLKIDYIRDTSVFDYWNSTLNEYQAVQQNYEKEEL